jgi:hypothetical protein
VLCLSYCAPHGWMHTFAQDTGGIKMGWPDAYKAARWQPVD